MQVEGRIAMSIDLAVAAALWGAAAFILSVPKPSNPIGAESPVRG